MNKNDLVQTVKDMIAAQSCCKELKAAGEKYLKAIGSAEEKTAAAELLQEIREDIATIDHVIEFFESPKAVEIFGAEKAKAIGGPCTRGQSCRRKMVRLSRLLRRIENP